jgi:hypothetical protein
MEPAPVAFAHFRPALALARDLKREDAHLAWDRKAVGEPLLIHINPNRNLPDAPLQASLFIGFALGGTVGLETTRGLALWDHPAPGLPRGDQHHPKLPLVIEPKGQGTDLLARLAPFLVGLWIADRRRKINSASLRRLDAGHQVLRTV